MNLTPREKDKLLIAMAAEVARKRLARGVKLNHPEAIALITDAVVEGAREAVAVLTGRDPRDVVLTSGGTEANNVALRSAFAGEVACDDPEIALTIDILVERTLLTYDGLLAATCEAGPVVPVATCEAACARIGDCEGVGGASGTGLG